MDFQTLCIHGAEKKHDGTGAICVPIYQSATFAHPGPEQSTGYDYSRSQNPTRVYKHSIYLSVPPNDDVDYAGCTSL